MSAGGGAAGARGEAAVTWVDVAFLPWMTDGAYLRLRAAYDDAQALRAAGPCAAARAVGLAPERAAERLSAASWAAARRDLEVARRMGRVLALDDADYPSLLRQVFEPPRFLAVRGRLDDDERLRVAVVGSRTTDHRSRDAAGELARGLAERGYCVVSGLARGVDTAAHEGALAVGGRTIAVLGTGLDVVYPAQNEGLARAIAESGALVSPFAPGTGPRKLNFPHRNKTIAGLCRAVVVVQAPERSGALITARLALHADRDVLAMPGPVGDARYAGSNRLLREGAAVCLDIGDVVAQIEGPEAALAVWGAASGAPRTTGLTEDERAVFESVATDAVHVDEIARACGLAPAALLPVLLRLELKGALRALPGAHFARRATIGALAAPPAPCRARG